MISPDLIRAQLSRILEHRLFVRSARVRRFLEFTVQYLLAGRADELKEYLLGVEVFDRTAEYDPRIDPIVRVEARRVRTKVRAYYRTEGADDLLLIQYPCGSYVPEVILRQAENARQQPALIAVLPFIPHGQRSSMQFAEGLTREVIRELIRSRAVRVLCGPPRGRSSARVEGLLTGTVSRRVHRVRVTAHLLSTGNARNLWSAAFESEPRDQITAQKQIAFATAHALSLHFIQRKSEFSPRSDDRAAVEEG